MMMMLWTVILVTVLVIDMQSFEIIHMSDLVPDRIIVLPCIDHTMLYDDTTSSGCRSEYCGRRVIDGAFNDSDVSKLHEIVTKAMSHRVVQSGPTILDINTGYIRDTNGLDNLFYRENNAIYSVDDFTHYGNIIRKLKGLVMDTFNVSELYFTSPTFITRLSALDSSWEPKGDECRIHIDNRCSLHIDIGIMPDYLLITLVNIIHIIIFYLLIIYYYSTEIHDEYWHPHVDHNNTGHYHYSGLLYLSLIHI